MKKKTNVPFLIVVLFAFGCEKATDPPAIITIFETSFQSGDSTAIANWEIFDGNGALRRSWASLSADAPPGDENALVLTVPAPDYPQYVNAMRMLPPVDGTHRYRLSLWMKQSGKCWAGVGSAKLDRNPTSGAIPSWSFLTGAGIMATDTAWKAYSVEGNVSVRAGDSLAIYLRVDSLAGKFDILRLERLD